MFHLPSDIFIKVGLVLGQHLQHQTQVQPPLLLRHSMPMGEHNTNISCVLAHLVKTCGLSQPFKLSTHWVRWCDGLCGENLLKVSVALQFSYRTEGQHLPVHANHTSRISTICKHAAWKRRDTNKTKQCISLLVTHVIKHKQPPFLSVPLQAQAIQNL